MGISNYSGFEAYTLKVRMGILGVFLFSLGAGAAWAQSEDNASASSRLKISVEKKVELLTVMQLLADWPSHFPILKDPAYRISYRNRIAAYFKDGLENHPSILTLRRYQRKGFTFDAPVKLLFYTSALPELKLVTPLPRALLRRVGGAESARKYLKAVRAFYAASNFEKFYRENGKYYALLVRRVKKLLGKPDEYLDFLEEMFGKQGVRYQVVLSTVFPHNNYGFSVGKDHFNVTSPGFKYNKARPLVVKDKHPVYQLEAMEFILTHEFSHPYVNPLVDRFQKELDKRLDLYKPIQMKMRKLAYTGWDTTLKEHFIRALSILFLERKYGKERARRELTNQQVNWGFAYIKPIYRSYQKRLGNGVRYSLAFPKIVSDFVELP